MGGANITFHIPFEEGKRPYRVPTMKEFAIGELTDKDAMPEYMQLLGIYLPSAGAGDWDPEWEETWYWEGYDYPQTDVAYEKYDYVDESGAYDWDNDDDIIYEDYSYP
jgi:hypothetical protein